MKYTVVFTERFNKSFSKLDNYTQTMIIHWIEKHLSNIENPRMIGKSLSTNLSGSWRYRIGDYRLICEIFDDKLIILALTIEHRKDIYK